MEAQLAEPAAAPDPMCFYRVDQQADDTGINTIRGKLCPFCHSTGHDGRCRCAEHQVEYKIAGIRKSLFRRGNKFFKMSK